MAEIKAEAASAVEGTDARHRCGAGAGACGRSSACGCTTSSLEGTYGPTAHRCRRRRAATGRSGAGAHRRGAASAHRPRLWRRLSRRQAGADAGPAIVGRIVAASDDPSQSYRITILNSPSVNAFALPGGYLYVTRAAGAGERLVRGRRRHRHEMGHVTANHAMQRQNKAQTAVLVSRVVSERVAGWRGRQAGARLEPEDARRLLAAAGAGSGRHRRAHHRKAATTPSPPPASCS